MGTTCDDEKAPVNGKGGKQVRLPAAKFEIPEHGNHLLTWNGKGEKGDRNSMATGGLLVMVRGINKSFPSPTRPATVGELKKMRKGPGVKK